MNLTRVWAVTYKEWREILRDRLFFAMAFLLPLGIFLVVGFGISRREHVAQVAAHADGVVVGSALVNVICDRLDRRDEIAPALGALAADLAAGTIRRG